MPTTTRTLSEAESLQLVARYGVPVVPHQRAADADEAAAAADEVGYPVAVKLHGARITHKTERSLVRLGVAGADAVRDAAAELLASARKGDGPVDLLVSRMAAGTRELVAGMHDDPQFGRCVMVGLGGVLAEALADVAFGLVPLEPIDAADMIDDLTHQTLLGPVRGDHAIDRDALGRVLMALSTLAAHEPSVSSVDVNPLVVVGGVPVAVDALVELVA